MKIDKKIYDLTVSKGSSLEKALKIIEKGEERICFLVDSKNRLISTVSDGDIRRALISGLTLKDKIGKMKLRKPITIKKGTNLFQASKKFNSRINVIPEVNERGFLTGILKEKNLNSFLNIKSKDVLVIGLGYVGLTLALVLSESGYSVSGYDIDSNLRKKIQNKISPFYEEGIEDLIDTQLGHNFRVLDKVRNIDADVFIVAVGTPFDKTKNKPNTKYLEKSIELVSKNVKENDLVILRSTVPIGCSRKVVKKILEKNSGLKIGENLFLAFCPERTSEGQAIKELKKLPQIIGGYCPKSTELAARFFNEYTHTIIDVDNLESAEMCKLLDNTYRDTVFAYSNQMSLISEKLGLNLPNLIDKVNIGYDRNKIPKPSPGVGGPCLTKDPYILNSSFKEKGLRAEVSLAARKVNEKMVETISKRIIKFIKISKKKNAFSKIFILGLAFKGEPETSDIRGSTSLDIIKNLKQKGFKKIFVHDPIIKSEEYKKNKLKYSNLENGFKKCDVAIFMTNHKLYKDLKIIKLVSKMSKPCLFFDSWQLFDHSKIQNFAEVNYASIGLNLIKK